MELIEVYFMVHPDLKKGEYQRASFLPLLKPVADNSAHRRAMALTTDGVVKVIIYAPKSVPEEKMVDLAQHAVYSAIHYLRRKGLYHLPGKQAH
jgi:hypothetical protein